MYVYSLRRGGYPSLIWREAGRDVWPATLRASSAAASLTVSVGMLLDLYLLCKATRRRMSAAQKVAGNTFNIKLYALHSSLGPFNGHSNIFDYSFRSAALISPYSSPSN